MEYSIPYGRTKLDFHIPDQYQVDIIAPKEVSAATNPLHVVHQALDNPVGDRRLEDFKSAVTAAIAINDKTRPVPHNYLLPPLLERLISFGLKPSDTTLFIATGTHPPLHSHELVNIVPKDILASHPVISHNAAETESLIDLGKTTRGTPILVNERYYRADIKIVVGNIEPHQFQGFSGGVKSAAIGLAGKRTINHNHSMMTDPKAALGKFTDNPARQDVEDIGRVVGVHFALNAILNEEKEIVHALAGDPVAGMQTGIPLARDICLVKVDKTYDLVISSPGGHPKDINLYQSQKGLAHTRMITRKSGAIILAAACPEGTGSGSYEEWMHGVDSYQEVFHKFEQDGFRVGPHKAYQIARDAVSVKLFLYSEMDKDLSGKLLLNPISDIQSTIDGLISNLNPDCHIAVMPYASSTIADIERKD